MSNKEKRLLLVQVALAPVAEGQTNPADHESERRQQQYEHGVV